MDADRPIRSVVIVGGGTAGWITAGILAARHHAGHPDGLKVTLVESPNVKIIGVGEGTWPTMRGTLQRLRVSESDFLRACDATFKQASKFVNWVAGDDAYYHPFTEPHAFGDVNLAASWLKDSKGLSFGDAVSAQPAICERRLAPKTITTPEYAGMAAYAYHLDAPKFAAFLKDHGTQKLGVEHVLADMTGVETDDGGHITALRIEGGLTLQGDLFVDCTGFSSLLLGKHFGVPFKSCRDQLFIDTALAIQVPYASPEAAVPSATLSTAHRAGWIWDIGLTTRRGTGHVFSSDFTGDDEAFEDLKTYLGGSGAGLNAGDVRKIPIHSGYRETFWVGNCVAVGLAAGFVEPLEASSIVMVELAAQMIADQMPASRGVMPVIARRFNEITLYRWRRIIDFLKLHYFLSRRGEPFWAANRDPATVPESLRAHLDLWRHHVPWHDDSDRKSEIFSAASYQYVLYGMGFRTSEPPWAALGCDQGRVDTHFTEVAKAREILPGRLPANRDLLSRIGIYGLQKI